jgi:hypothetical protein
MEVRLARHAVCLLQPNLNWREDLGKLGITESIILKWIFKKLECAVLGWIHLSQDFERGN